MTEDRRAPKAAFTAHDREADANGAEADGTEADARGAETDAREAEAEEVEPETQSVAPKPKRKKGPTAAQTMGGIIFGFEQQVWRTAPPPQELVEHARPDKPVPAPDGSFFTIVMPDDLAIDDEKETR